MTNEQKEDLDIKIEAIRNEEYSNYSYYADFDHNDIIYTRDLQDKIDNFQLEFNSLITDYENAKEGDLEFELNETAENLLNWLDENGDEFVTLLVIKEEVEQYTGDGWKHGAVLIADSHFETYAKELANDIGVINKNFQWPLTHIDWNSAADELKQDYSEVTIVGKSYWV